jgi:hypothetical protein
VTERDDSQLIRGERYQLIESVHCGDSAAGQAGASVGLVCLALECVTDVAQLAQLAGLLAVDAVGNQDAPAA